MTEEHNDLVVFTEYLTELAERVAAFSDVTNSEKEMLRQAAEQLSSSVEALITIFAAHDALQKGDTHWREPYDSHGPRYLWAAIAAAYWIGGRVTPNPIIERFEQEKQKASAAHARGIRLSKSKEIDHAILDLVVPLWKRQPTARKSPGWTARQIAEPLNRGLSRKLKKSAIEKRVRNLIKSPTTGQSSA